MWKWASTKGGVQRLVCGGLQAGRDFDKVSILHGQRHTGAAVGEGGVGDQKIEHVRGFQRTVGRRIPERSAGLCKAVTRRWPERAITGRHGPSSALPIRTLRGGHATQ